MTQILLELKRRIDNLDELQKQEVFKIMLQQNEKYTSNINGIFVNLSILNKSTITDINKYIEFCALNNIYLEKLNEERSLELNLSMTGTGVTSLPHRP
jgi:hypothetical protein